MEDALCQSCQQAKGTSSGAGGLPKNMPNLGNTCYAGSSVQILKSLVSFDNALRKADFVCKPLKESGRSSTEWLPPGSATPKSTAEEESIFSTHLQKSRNLAVQLRNLLGRLDHNEEHNFSWNEMQVFFSAVNAFNRNGGMR